MSSLRKSASFRSRIPVRRTRLPHRRCASPDHSTSVAASTVNSVHGSESSIATDAHGAVGLFGKAVGQQPKAWYDRSHCYSSSSYSSSDESYDSEAAPFQHLLNQSSAVASATGGPYQHQRQQQEHHRQAALNHRQHEEQYQHFDHQRGAFGTTSSCLSTSTDAMSLDGLLDCVSTGTFSCPPSPKSKSYLDNGEEGGRQSGFYESLEELNYALKTLIISDSLHAQRNIRNATSTGTNVPLADVPVEALSGDVECSVPYSASFDRAQYQQHGGVASSENLTAQRFVKPSQIHQLQEQSQPVQATEEEDDDIIKQRKLSDWYYIKTAPTKKPSSPFERRRAIGNRAPNDATRRTATRLTPTLAPRASNPDITSADERLSMKLGAESKQLPHGTGIAALGDRKFPSPVPRPRRLPPSIPTDGLQQHPGQHSWDQETRWRQHPNAVTKSASSSSVNFGLRGQLQSLGASSRGATTRLHSNSDLQQAGTRKAIAPALMQDDSLGSLDDSSSLAVLGGSLALESTDDRDRFSPYCRRRNPHQLVPQWFPPPPPPPYHYPHQHQNSGVHHEQREQRNIYENFPASTNQHTSTTGRTNNDELLAESVPEAPTPTARTRIIAHPTNSSPHTNRPGPTLYGIEENERLRAPRSPTVSHSIVYGWRESSVKRIMFNTPPHIKSETVCVCVKLRSMEDIYASRTSFTAKYKRP
uniref:Uncharacterized protein n=1 Tax=Anopheles farauti TaxID=69004 RepID=A0A182QH27_9DIPT